MAGPGNIVEQATQSARRAVLLAIMGASVVIVGLAVQHSVFNGLHAYGINRIMSAHEAMDVVSLGLSRMRTAVELAAATGDLKTFDEYQRELPEIERAIKLATQLGISEAQHQLLAEALSSQRKLLELDAKAFAYIREGKLFEARGVLGESSYHDAQQRLMDYAEQFLEAIKQNVAEDQARIELRERVILALLVPIAIIAALALWRHLNVSMKRSEGAHLAAEGKIRSLALNDTLTGLSNRMSLRDGLLKAMARSQESSTKVAVLMIDLDRFKPVNDRHGHLVGDLVLKEVAKRLSRTVRSNELCGRFGGDEFVAVVEYDSDDQVPRRVAARLVEALSEPMTFQDLTVQIGASIGLAIYPTDAMTEDELIGKADIALYKAKQAGRGVVRWFDAGMDIDIKKCAELEAEIEQAINNKEFVPWYQPVVDLRSGRLAGFEILSRWHHPKRGLIQPTEFIPIAEKTGMIDDLMLAVLQKACLDVRPLPQHLTFAINVAPRQIQDERIAHRILAILGRTKMAPNRLEVELTESALVSDIEAAKQVITTMKSLGIRVALDDFGTGYSSLSYLSDLPFDKIKIDRSFIKTVHDRRESYKIVSAIVGLGRSLGVATVAEGIESKRDEEVLRAIGCTYAQGYLYSRPAPSADLEDLVERLGDPVIRAVSA